jgi:hypothetical protein
MVEVDGALTQLLHGAGQAPRRPIRVPFVFGTRGPKGKAAALRARIDELGARGMTEIAYQPSGGDIPRELTAFARMAGIG